MSAGIIFETSDGKRLKLDAAVLERFALYRQVSPRDREAGGVLLGRHLLDSSDLVVDEVTEPMRGDHRARFEFRRGKESHQRRVDEVWRTSRGTCVYLGEWHTHPEATPRPSSTDMSDWNRHLRTDVFEGDTLYFIIVGTGSIGAWEGTRTRCLIRYLGHVAPLSAAGVWRWPAAK